MRSGNEIAAEGLPGFLLKDIPPVTSNGLEVVRPELYYGKTCAIMSSFGPTHPI